MRTLTAFAFWWASKIIGITSATLMIALASLSQLPYFCAFFRLFWSASICKAVQ